MSKTQTSSIGIINKLTKRQRGKYMKTKFWVRVLSFIMVGLMGLGSATIAIAVIIEALAK
jgi:hypothetical protein